MNKTFRVWYKSNPSFRVDSSSPFYAEEDYTFMGRFEAANIDELFANLNDAGSEPNPLGTRERQDFIRHNLLHTSMSVGDLAVDDADGCAYLCDSFGWKKVLKKSLIYP